MEKAEIMAVLNEWAQTAVRKEYLSIKEAAVYTGLSSSHLRRSMFSGHLPFSNVSSRDRPVYRLARRALDEWMKKMENAPLPVKRKVVSRHHCRAKRLQTDSCP